MQKNNKHQQRPKIPKYMLPDQSEDRERHQQFKNKMQIMKKRQHAKNKHNAKKAFQNSHKRPKVQRNAKHNTKNLKAT